MWRTDQLYFVPSTGVASYKLSGTSFLRESSSCCELSESGDGTVKAKAKKCSPSIKNKALRKYSGIKDFQRFKSELVNCLQLRKRDCLEPMISRNFQASFGSDGYGDLRDLALKTWKDSDLEKMRKLIAAGVTGDGGHRSFPPQPDNDGTGWRGEFELTENGWLLKSFLAGD